MATAGFGWDFQLTHALDLGRRRQTIPDNAPSLPGAETGWGTQSRPSGGDQLQDNRVTQPSEQSPVIVSPASLLVP